MRLSRLLPVLLLLGMGLGAKVALAQLGSVLAPLPEAAEKDEPALHVEWEDVTVADALAQLSKDSGYLFLAEKDLREKKITLKADAKAFDIMLRIGRQLTAYPYGAFFFCTEEQVPKKEPKMKFPDDKKVTCEVSNTDTDIALDLVALSAGVKLMATDEVLKAKPKIDVKLEDKSVEEALKELAETLDCKLTRGLLLVAIDPDSIFRQFMNLSTEEQEKTLLEAARRLESLGLTDQEIDKHIDQALEQLWQMPQAQRQMIIQNLAARMSMVAGAMRGFSPQALSQLSSAMGPFIQRGVNKFMSLPANRQAELSPLLNAMRQLPFHQGR